MKEKMIVSVKMVPLQGKSSVKRHEVPVTVKGTTVGKIAAQLGIDLTNRNVTIDGVPADKTTVVKAKSKLEMTEVQALDLTVTERPQGS